MGKLIKRCGAFMMMLLLVIGILPITANAETTQNTETRNALDVQIPEDWMDPCVWAWDSDGNNAFAAWPGEEMEQDAENTGWYYIWLPEWANHVIINANEGNIQTDEQILDTNAAWLTVTAADAVDISYEKQTTGETPDYVEKFVVHAKVEESWDTPCLWAWSAPDGTNAFAAWPGETLEEGENGWFVKDIPGWVNSVIVNGNDGSVQTTDISVETGKDIWLVVNGPEDYTVSYEEISLETTEQSAETESSESVATESIEAPEDKEKSVPVVPIAVGVLVVVAVAGGVAAVAKKKSRK